MTYEQALSNLVEMMEKDFSLQSFGHLPNEYSVESGRSYDKIISNNGVQKSVKGFICKKDNDKKGFKVGDMLKAATYNAPATNFTRGNIFDENVRIGWLGIM
jgi:hypothetical protein